MIRHWNERSLYVADCGLILWIQYWAGDALWLGLYGRATEPHDKQQKHTERAEDDSQQ